MSITSFKRSSLAVAVAVSLGLGLTPVASAAALPSATSGSAASRAVVAKPTITGQPASPTVVTGNAVRFSVRATGAGLTYRWEESLAGHPWATIPNAKAADLYVAAVPGRNKAHYRAIVANTGGQVYSHAAMLTVVVPRASISAQPVNVRVVSGQLATFSVKATGLSLGYRWQGKVPGKDWGYIAGATKSSYSVRAIVARNGYQFRAVINNPGGQVNSGVAGLGVDPTRADPYRANVASYLTKWGVVVRPTNTDAAAEVKTDKLGPPPLAGNRYVAAFVDVRYLGAGSTAPYVGLDVEFIGGDGRTYTDTNRLYWNNSIYSIDPLYYGATAEFATIVEVPAAAVAGGRWRIDDTTDYSNIRTTWYGLS
ncbi:hypothetical protein ABIB25_002169 [Nakamurella sp. UYEF19]|uniref:hypothetical protein n=1 Tax=Nakamurella sp. UYEF19 TaxID=1756392 RepID=UPI00339631D8